jgi:hypothetical protein
LVSLSRKVPLPLILRVVPPRVNVNRGRFLFLVPGLTGVAVHTVSALASAARPSAVRNFPRLVNSR